MFRSFDADSKDARGFGIKAHAVQQNSFANPAQSDHDDTFGGVANAQALDADIRLSTQLVAPG
jgi:uncharacterized protein (DUF1800 family)